MVKIHRVDSYHDDRGYGEDSESYSEDAYRHGNNKSRMRHDSTRLNDKEVLCLLRKLYLSENEDRRQGRSSSRGRQKHGGGRDHSGSRSSSVGSRRRGLGIFSSRPNNDGQNSRSKRRSKSLFGRRKNNHNAPRDIQIEGDGSFEYLEEAQNYRPPLPPQHVNKCESMEMLEQQLPYPNSRREHWEPQMEQQPRDYNATYKLTDADWFYAREQREQEQQQQQQQQQQQHQYRQGVPPRSPASNRRGMDPREQGQIQYSRQQSYNASQQPPLSPRRPSPYDPQPTLVRGQSQFNNPLARQRSPQGPHNTVQGFVVGPPRVNSLRGTPMSPIIEADEMGNTIGHNSDSTPPASNRMPSTTSYGLRRRPSPPGMINTNNQPLLMQTASNLMNDTVMALANSMSDPSTLPLFPVRSMDPNAPVKQITVDPLDNQRDYVLDDFPQEQTELSTVTSEGGGPMRKDPWNHSPNSVVSQLVHDLEPNDHCCIRGTAWYDVIHYMCTKLVCEPCCGCGSATVIRNTKIRTFAKTTGPRRGGGGGGGRDKDVFDSKLSQGFREDDNSMIYEGPPAAPKGRRVDSNINSEDPNHYQHHFSRHV